MLPHLVALCPTYRRPRCLENVLACWLAQDYPADRRELIILDDAGQWPTQSGPGWRLIGIPERFDSLPAKYNTLASLAPDADGYIVWEDDDVYLPWHLSSHAATLAEHGFSRPTVAWSNYGLAAKAIQTESATGRFHGSWAYRRDAFERVGGYRETRELSFDQELGGRLSAGGDVGDSCGLRGPHYVFRFGNPYYHGQAFGDSFHEATEQMGDGTPQGQLVAAMDAETQRIYRELGV